MGRGHRIGRDQIDTRRLQPICGHLYPTSTPYNYKTAHSTAQARYVLRWGGEGRMKAGISLGLSHMHVPIFMQQNLLTRLSLSRINKHLLTFLCTCLLAKGTSVRVRDRKNQFLFIEWISSCVEARHSGEAFIHIVSLLNVF